MLSIHEEVFSNILFFHHMEESFCWVIDHFLNHSIDRNEVIHRSVSNDDFTTLIKEPSSGYQ